MVLQGDVETIEEWQTSSSIDAIKRVCEEQGYSAFSVGEGYSHATLKQFAFPVTPALCTAAPGTTFYILSPAASLAQVADGPPETLGTQHFIVGPSKSNTKRLVVDLPSPFFLVRHVCCY
jgi:hypothetical protein